jgi:hypothetical protein
MTDLRHDERNEGTGFEKRDLSAKPIFGFLISLVLIGIVIYYGIWGIFWALDAYNRQHQPATSPLVKVQPNTRTVEPGSVEQTFPEPRLETNERTEINDFRLGEEQQLDSYGWVDQSAGIVHIPITRAMQLIAERGLPTRPQVGTVPASPVNLARAAAAAADTSNLPKHLAGKQTKKGKKQ